MVLVQSSGVSRIIFTVLLVSTLLLIIYNFSALRSRIPTAISRPQTTGGSAPKFQRPKHGGSLKGIDPLLKESENDPVGKIVGPGEANRTSATILSLVRNEELEGILQSMRDLEATWNHKFNYPWTFFNDVPFSKEFKEKTQAATKAECRYGMQSGEFLSSGKELTKHCRTYPQRALGNPTLD